VNLWISRHGYVGQGRKDAMENRIAAKETQRSQKRGTLY